MALIHFVIMSLILAGLSLVLQTITFIIPGWLIIEKANITFNMALWYVIMCELKTNLTTKGRACDTVSYKTLFDRRSAGTVSHIPMEYTSIVDLQLQVTSCYILTVTAFLLIIYQLKTFHSQVPGQPGIYDDDPPDTCNMRAKFICSGGLAGLLQVFAGPLQELAVYNMAVNFYKLGEPRPDFPFSLVILGVAGGLATLSGFTELLIAFRTRKNPSGHIGRNHIVELVGIDGKKTHASCSSHPPDNLEYNGDYYGQDYDVVNPTYHTQGHRHNGNASGLFPGYRLGRQNLQGHDKKWWRKVTFASMPLM